MFESIILGIVQGIFEWLPISSQGNLVILMVGVFDIGIETAFKYSIFLHLGTLLSVLVYFRKDIIKILFNLKKYKLEFKDKKNGLISFLIISCLITGIIGYPLLKIFSDFSVKGELFLGLIGLALIFTGLLQKFAKKSDYEEKRLTFKDSVVLGIVQGLAVIPGISRSGITISTFLLKKYNPKQGLYLSFLMSIPVLLIAGILLPVLDGIPNVPVFNLILGLIFSFVFGLITIKVLLSFAQKFKFWLFAVVIGVLAFLPLIFSLF